MEISRQEVTVDDSLIAENGVEQQTLTELLGEAVDFMVNNVPHFVDGDDSSAYVAGLREYQVEINRRIGIDFVHPSELPENAPEHVKRRILTAINERYPHTDPVETLSKAVDRYGINADRLKGYALGSYDEEQLLRAAAYAGKSRQTQAGERLFKKARSILLNKAHSPFMRPGAELESDEYLEKYYKYTERSLYQSASLAAVAQLDLFVASNMPREVPLVSVDGALSVLSRPSAEIIDYINSEFERKTRDDTEVLSPEADHRNSFRTLNDIEVQRRLANLPLVEAELRGIFGEDAHISYKEINPLYDASIRDLAESTMNHAASYDDLHATSKESSSDFLDYVFVEITPSSGHAYVIAESPLENNACYVLRSDVVAGMSEILDVNLSWEDILQYPKETVRQLGAQRYYHSVTVDVVDKVARYSQASTDDILKSFAHKWVVRQTRIYDDKLEATSHNRLPKYMRDIVQDRQPEVRQTLLRWAQLDELPERPVDGPEVALGRAALAGGREQRGGSSNADISEGNEAARLMEELAQAREHIAQLEADNRKLKQMLTIAIGDIGTNDTRAE